MKFIGSTLNKNEIEITPSEGKDAVSLALKNVKLTASYDDGSSKEYKIRWDAGEVEALANEKNGRLQLHGQVVFPEYDKVLVEERADPYILLAEDGWYYFTASYPVRGTKENKEGIGYDRIVLRRAKTIQGLKEAEEVTIWHQKDSKRLHRYIWAPELHKIGDSYYILFTGSVDPENVWSIRPHMLKCVGKNLMDPKSWYAEDESNLYRLIEREDLKGEGRTFVPFSDFSLDMTCFENKGRWYLIWAQKGEDQLSDLFLAEINPRKPWEIISKPMLLTNPEYDWEMRGGVKVDEGPSVLKHGDKLFVAFSASATDYTYCIGMLMADCNADLLDKKNWKKFDHPFLRSEDFLDQCGPGHNSFTKDENGNDVLVYHARPFACSNAQDAEGHYGECEYVEPGKNPLSDPCRHARAKAILFDEKGIPVLHMTPEEELPESARKVELWVTIQ